MSAPTKNLNNVVKVELKEFPLLLLSFKEDQLISLKDLQKLLIEPMLVVLKKFSETLRHDLFEIEQVPPSNDADEDNSKENPTEPSAEPGPVTNSSCSSNAVVDNSKPDIAGCQPTQQQ